MAERMIEGYENYAYPSVYQAASSFVTVDLSSFYVDVAKDRMYTLGARSEARRSGQTAMYLVAEGLERRSPRDSWKGLVEIHGDIVHCDWSDEWEVMKE